MCEYAYIGCKWGGLQAKDCTPHMSEFNLPLTRFIIFMFTFIVAIIQMELTPGAIEAVIQ